jgi:excisionase family DNA binding protein
MEQLLVTQVAPSQLEALIENSLRRVLSDLKSDPPKQEDAWMSLEDLRQYHPDKPSKQTIYQWVFYRQIPFHKGGKKLRFRKSEIDAWLNQSISSPSNTLCNE